LFGVSFGLGVDITALIWFGRLCCMGGSFCTYVFISVVSLCIASCILNLTLCYIYSDVGICFYLWHLRCIQFMYALLFSIDVWVVITHMCCCIELTYMYRKKSFAFFGYYK